MPGFITLLTTTMVLSATLSGCGLAGTSVVGAAAGASQVEQARQAKETEARVQKQLEAAAKSKAKRGKSAAKKK